MYRVGLYTLGCKVSQYETEAVAELFAERGYVLANFEEKNDVYVINTCTVTAESDRKCRQLIRRAIKTNPDAVVMVMGCYSQRAPEEVAKISGVSVVIGTENKLSLVDMATEALNRRECGETVPVTVNTTDVTKALFEPMKIKRAPRTRAYLKIEDGCESKCTYCAIAKARGRVRSKPPCDVIDEIRALRESGVREIVLVGIEVGAYGRDLSPKTTLADLLVAIDDENVCERIRLGSLAPELVDDAFIEKVSRLKCLAPHFHLSLQSGSDRVLRGMKRRYTSDGAMSVIRKIREKIPRATFTTDLMVGFPGETDEDFCETVKFQREARLLDAHVFAYSKRNGTQAAEFASQIPENIKRKRSEELIREKNLTRDALLSELVLCGEPLLAIAETRTSDSYYSAHSDTYVELRFYSECENLTGEMITLYPVSHKDGVVYCKL